MRRLRHVIAAASARRTFVLGVALTAAAAACGGSNKPPTGGGVAFERIGPTASLRHLDAHAISGDGKVVVGSAGPLEWQGLPWDFAVRWTADRGLESLDIPGAATATSRDGATVGGRMNVPPITARLRVSPTLAFRWTAAAGVQTLGDLDRSPNGYDVTAWTRRAASSSGRASEMSTTLSSGPSVGT